MDNQRYKMPQINETIKLFVTFLKENNAYVSFRVARKKQHESFFTILDYKHMEELKYNQHLLFNIISYAFCWANTKEGDIYWRSLNRKWSVFMRNNVMNPKLKDTPMPSDIYEALFSIS